MNDEQTMNPITGEGSGSVSVAAPVVAGGARPWWKDAKLYELYIDKFAGDLKGLTARLDYFTKLGVNTLHILPHYLSPMIDQGYDISDYRGVRPELGTLDDFKVFVAAAHEKGIRLITDFVLNHVSSQHPWFIEARASKDNPKRGYFLWSDTGAEFSAARNMFPDFKPSNWVSNEATGDYYYATFYAEQPDLNWDNPALVAEMLAAMDFWADIGVDGFRLDAAPYLVKRDGTNCRGLPETHAVIRTIRAHLDAKYPRGIVLLAEAHQEIEEIKKYFGTGDECTMAYHFPLMEQMWLALMDGDTSRVRRMVDASFDIPDNCQWGVFLRNHDEISLATLPEEEQHELVAFLDPDRKYPFKGGLWTSMRVATGLKNDPEKIRQALDLLYSTPGAPIMYYGDEIGMENEPVRDGVIDTRLYVRGQFDWVEAQQQLADPNSTFSYAAQAARRVPSELVLPEAPEQEVAAA